MPWWTSRRPRRVAEIGADGSQTATHCNIVVDREYYVQNSYDRNNWVYLWYAQQNAGGTAVGRGGSGGPVITNVANNHDDANGTISAGPGDGYSCTNNHGGTTTCFTGIGYVDEWRILNWLGAALLTF
jgi:hypothetical protein